MDFTWSIDMTIVIGFLFLTLFVGLGHGQKNKNIKDYALGGRNFSTGALVATLVATWVGGGAFTTCLTKTYSDGLFYVIASLGQIVSFIIVAFLFVPKMSKFLGKISVAEAMEEHYGANVRIIVAATGIMASAGSIAVQFKVFGNVISYFLVLSPLMGIFVASAIVTIYSAFGGVRAVTFTDVFQMLTFGVAIPIIGVMIWNNAHMHGFSLEHALQDPKFDIGALVSAKNIDIFAMFTLMLYYAMPGIEPTVFQRISMGRNIEQVKNAFLISAFVLFLIRLAMQWVPFLIYSMSPNLELHQLFGFIIDNYTYIGLKGLMIAGVFALAMSTADSQINASSVLFSHDICKSLNLRGKSELILSKIFSVFLGFVGIYMATSSKDLLDIVLTTRAFYMPIVTIPIMFTILGFRTTTYSVLAGMSGGFVVILAWKLSGIKADGIFVAMIANMLCLLGAHYLFKQQGGWIKDNNLKQHTINPISPSLLQRIKEFNYVEYCKRKSPTNELSYVGLGAYIIIFTVTTMYAIDLKDNSAYHSLLLVLYQIMMVTGVALCTYPIWPEIIQKKKISKLIWPIPIIIILMLFNTLFVIVNGPTTLQSVMFTVNLLISVILLGWKFGAVSVIFCTTSTYFICKHLGLVQELSVGTASPASIIIYIMMVVGAIIMLFVKPQEDTITSQKVKICDLEDTVTGLNETVTHYVERVGDQEKEIERLGSTARKILNNVNHELRLPVGNVVNFAEMLDEELNKLDSKELKLLSKEVHENSTRLSSMILNMLDLATLNAEKIELNKSIINFSELVKDRVSICRKIHLKKPNLDLSIKIQKNIFVNVDPNYIRQTVDNLIINAINFTSNGTIKISVITNPSKNNVVIFTIEDKGIGIPKSELYDIFTPFKMGSQTESKAEGRGIGLALCKSAIEAHGGKIEAESENGKGAKFTFTLSIVK